MSERRERLIQIIPGIHDIEEINSVVVKLDANSTSDLISKSLARVTASLKTNIMISKSTQILLGILPKESPHEVEKAYQAYRRYIMHKDMMTN